MYEEFKSTWSEFTAPGQIFEIETLEVRGSPMRTYKHAPASLRDIWLGTAAFEDREYLIYQDERHTYAQSHELTASIANWLSKQGVQPGDRVAIAMRNYPEWMLAYWAVVSMGAVVVGMNAWWVGKEMEFALKDSTPKVLIADKERLAQFKAIRASFPEMIAAGVRLDGETPDNVVDWSELVSSEPVMPEVVVDPDEDACIFYTSGTTGTPKGAQLTHRGCVSNLMNIGFSQAQQREALTKAGMKSKGSMAADQVNIALVATPLFHVTGNNCVAQGIAATGGKLIHMYKWDAGEALRIVEEEKVTTFSAVPMMSREMMLHPEFDSRDTSSLKSMGGGGAAVQPDLTRKMDETMKNAAPSAGYGMTETCGIISALSGEYLVDRPTSVGRAMPTFEAKCVDGQGNTVPTGEPGELWVRGPCVIKGYLNRSEATAETITDGWLHTGDIAYMDEDEFIHLVDRAKEMVLRGGENVYCAEVESAIFDQDAVAECVVFGVEDERLGEEVAAAIYPKTGATVDVDQLRKALRERMASYKIPRYIWVVDAPLPRNANGKFVKRDVRDSLSMEDAL
ncbi:Long-chain-fatty-acid--CoA ligase [Halioglobus japonicus]|nr:Long-chain-fatty-acid--CoA ligase [Halioglobus japonicus]